MSIALDEVADVVEEIASDQRQVARTARQMQAQRARGWSWARIVDHNDPAKVLELLRRSARRLAQVAVRLADTLAQGLSSEGKSHRQIAARLGLTHQRISAMRKRSERSAGSLE